MEKSPRFISLSGLTGVLAGIYVLIGGCYQASWFGISSSVDLQSKLGNYFYSSSLQAVLVKTHTPPGSQYDLLIDPKSGFISSIPFCRYPCFQTYPLR
ncbi:MAG: hypothetical protein ACJAXB_001159 [Candidatus Endobugula sp.]|jgi:hypothetical protein